MIKKQILLSMVLILTELTFGQDHYRILEMEYEYSPNNIQKNNPESSVDIQEYEINVSMPIKRSNGDAYVMGFGYNNFKLFPSIERSSLHVLSDTVMTGDNNYGRLRIQGGYSVKINEEKSIVYMGFFRVASDWVEVNSTHFLYGGLAMMTNKKSEKFTLKYGLYVNKEHYGWLIIPLVGLDWKVSDKFRIYGVLPRRVTGAWTLNNKFRAGIIFEAPNRSYRLSQTQVYRSNEVNSQEFVDTYVQNAKNVIYAFGEVYLTKGLILRTRVGFTIFREIELYEYQKEATYNTWGIEYGAKRTLINDVYAYRPLKDGLVLNASIEYRFNLE